MADVEQGISNPPAAIQVDTLKVTRYAVLLTEEKASARIQVIDSEDHVYDEFEVTFWATMPAMPEILDENGLPYDPPQYEDTPDTWFELPAATVPVLMQLATDILTATNNRFFP
jgi:hypothetical protein